MKILLLANADSIHTKRWAVGLSDQGFEIFIYSLEKLTDNFYRDYPNITLEYGGLVPAMLKNLKIDLTKLFKLRVILRLKKIISEFKPDILHSHYASSYGLLGTLTGFKPHFVSIWGSDVYLFPKKSFIHKHILKFVLKQATLVFSTSHNMKKEALKYANVKIKTIPFGINTDVFHSTQPPFSNNSLTIGIVKNLDPIYGIDLLMQAFKLLKLHLKDQEVKLMIIGKGDDKKNLEMLAHSLGISEDISFIENVPNNNIPTYLNKMDIVAFPSKSESFGVAAIEALACERPVIVSNVGGFPEVIQHNETGLVLKNRTPEDLFKAFMEYINNKDLAIAYGKKGRLFVMQHYNWQNNLNTQISFYQSIK